MLDCEFFAFDTVNPIEELMALYTFSTVSSLMILQTIRNVIDTVTLVKMHAKGTHGTSFGQLIVIKAGVDLCELSKCYNA